MRTLGPSAAAAIMTALLLAACGSSKKSSSTATSAAPASTSSTPATASSSAPVQVATKQTKLGTVLDAGPKKLTVYMFESDTAGKSSCTGACATVWPPVSGKPTAAGAANAANVGTITRPDGKTQVTYKGHPLYFYAKDGDAGDTYGETIKSFGGDWYVLAPSGNKVDKS